jgi:hypothetical protein
MARREHGLTTTWIYGMVALAKDVRERKHDVTNGATRWPIATDIMPYARTITTNSDEQESSFNFACVAERSAFPVAMFCKKWSNFSFVTFFQFVSVLLLLVFSPCYYGPILPGCCFSNRFV